MKVQIKKETNLKKDLKIIWTKVDQEKDFISIEEAKNNLIIEETGSVNSIFLRNLSTQNIIITEGDILIGGKQNRSLKFSLVLQPGEEIIAPVYCIERNRWHHPEERENSTSLRNIIRDSTRRLNIIEERISRNEFYEPREILRLADEFQEISDILREAYRKNEIYYQNKSKGKNFRVMEYMATYQLRMAKINREQDTVWREVDEELRKFSKENQTSDFSKIYENFKKHKTKIPKDTNGLIIVHNSIPVIYEIFYNSKVFKSYAEKLINAYLLNPVLPKNNLTLEEFIEKIQSFSKEDLNPATIIKNNVIYEGENYKLLSHKELGDIHFLFMNN